MDRSIVLLCLHSLLAFPLTAQAQHVYKCVEGRDTSYQSAPCEDGKHLARTWDAPPEPAPSPEQLAWQREVQAKGARESDYLRSLARRAGTGARRPRSTGATISAARDGDRCAGAKKHRDDTERRLGLNRTFETMQRLSRLVSEACR